MFLWQPASKLRLSEQNIIQLQFAPQISFMVEKKLFSIKFKYRFVKLGVSLCDKSGVYFYTIIL